MLIVIWRLVIKQVLNYEILTKKKLCVIKKDQLLLYIREKRSIEKIYVIYTLERKFVLLNKSSELILLALIKGVAKDIRKRIIQIVLIILYYNANNMSININK